MTSDPRLSVVFLVAVLAGCRTREAIPPARSVQQRVLSAYATVEKACELASARKAPPLNDAPLEIGSYRLRLGDTVKFEALTVDYFFHFLPHGHGRPHGRWEPAVVATLSPRGAEPPPHAFSWMLGQSYEGARRRHIRKHAHVEVGPFAITALAEGPRHALVRVFLRPGVCDGVSRPR